MNEDGHLCLIWPFYSSCYYLSGRSRRKKCCLCWRFLFSNEQNCSCFACPHEEDKPCQCCHCSCAEHANCWWCCCSFASDPDCKFCCCSEENSGCQYYECKCFRSSIYEPYHSRTPGTVQLKDVMSRFRTGNNATVITSERKVFSHTFHDQLACPLCKQLFLQPFMLPCNHCICEKCLTKSKTKADVTEDFYIIVCPVCHKAHCLPYTNKIHLRKDYLRAKLAKKYMRRHGLLRWRFDHSEKTVYCETCRERRRVATRRCRTCGINYCNECLRLNHNEYGTQDHIFTRAQDREEWRCLFHSNSNISEYCLDDHELICGLCRNSLHNNHEVIPLAVACSREAASLFDTIEKFRQVRQGVDKDLMEVLLLKNNFKIYKDNKSKEIRNGFLKLRMALHEQEKEMMELLENIELRKQKEISEYINHTTGQLSYMDGLIHYSEEALKEENQFAFLQSAHSLVKEIENAVPSVFQPSPYLREDPLRKLQLNFDELFCVLQRLVPPLTGIKQSESKTEKYPYSFNPEIMVPRHISNTHESKQATGFQNPSLNPMLDLGVRSKDTVRSPSSTPPHHPTQNNEVCVYQDTACETPRKERKQIHTFSSPEPTDDESVPGPVVIYQTVVYSRSAKIYWTCPTEDMDFFEVEFYEVARIGSDNIVQMQLAGQLSKIQQQNLEIHNLDPNTEYIFKVRAVNASGRGQWSEICKIITSDEYGKTEDKGEKQKSNHSAPHIQNI